MPVSPARAAAFDILLRVEREDSYAGELLHSARCANLSAADHGFATELVMGTLRWRSTLDASIASASSQPLSKLDSEVLTALRLGAYQLGWLDRVPARAALHESVELVKRARKRSAAPFVNAVLRKLSTTLPTAIRATAIASAVDPATLATESAHPEWLVQRWCAQFGLETARRICAYDQAVPTTALRLRDPSCEAELRGEGIELAPGDLLTSARRVISGDVTRTRAFATNRIAIQDEASQLVAALVGHGVRILDCCAAPGGKTQSMADRNPNSQVVAVELHSHRAQQLRKRISGSNIEVFHADIRELPLGEAFDRVLADVPCSGTGTLARNPEIKWRLQPYDLTELQERQLAILRAAMRHISRGGRLIYSTCSLEREEDEAVVAQALATEPSFRLLDCRLELVRLEQEGELRLSTGEAGVSTTLDSLVSGAYLRTIPGVHSCDGFFAAIFERS